MRASTLWGAELEQLSNWLLDGHQVALATVVATWGSSPRTLGSHMVVRDDQQFAGSVSGGCIEGEVIRGALAAIKNGQSRLLRFQVANERAWEMGLSCGGEIEVRVEAVGRDHPLAQAVAQPNQAQTLWRLVSLDNDREWLINPDYPSTREGIPPELKQPLNRAIDAGICVRLDVNHFLQRYRAPTRLFIIGAVHTAQQLAAMATRCDLAPLVVDPRRGFARQERFPDTPLIQKWPDRLFAERSLNTGSALVTLSHDPKIDDPALCAALDSEAFYIGALGSRKTHGERLKRLTEKGYGNQLRRIHAPVGLDLGGRTPAEIAVAILAQLIQARYRPTTDREST